MDKYRELRKMVNEETGDAALRASIASLLAERDVLLEALEELLASIGGGKKQCDHDFDCICADDKARAAIEAAKRQEGV